MSVEKFKELVAGQLTIDPARIPIIIISGICIYLAFLLLVRIFGIRVLAKMNTFDAVVIVMFGAVAGRVILGHPPTLFAGILSLTTLMAMEAVFGMVRDVRGIRDTLAGRPQVVVAQGEIIESQLRKVHVRRADIRHAVRRAGIPNMRYVQLMILEPNGEMSLFRTGEPVDPELLKGVAGVEYLYP
ncbi:MAG: DUF421 domain-containing protein [Corynebacterium sp.]|nr:DUF421 domain-containing protein [Corynebacterium sp.]